MVSTWLKLAIGAGAVIVAGALASKSRAGEGLAQLGGGITSFVAAPIRGAAEGVREVIDVTRSGLSLFGEIGKAIQDLGKLTSGVIGGITPPGIPSCVSKTPEEYCQLYGTHPYPTQDGYSCCTTKDPMGGEAGGRSGARIITPITPIAPISILPLITPIPITTLPSPIGSDAEICSSFGTNIMTSSPREPCYRTSTFETDLARGLFTYADVSSGRVGVR